MPLTERHYSMLLSWANRVRARAGGPPVQALRRGRPQESGRCALSNTINYRLPRNSRINVDESEAYRGEDPFAPHEVLAKTPNYVERFIRDFDRGRYPEAVGRGWAEPVSRGS